MADAHKNFAISLVATAPSPATTGTSLVVTGGEGTKFPAVPFNAVIWPTATLPTSANAEIVRVTNISTDTLTITREQESTTARTVIVGDQIAASITAKTLEDVEAGSKITELTEDTALVETDLTIVVEDPGGTPVTKKVTLLTLDEEGFGRDMAISQAKYLK